MGGNGAQGQRRAEVRRVRLPGAGRLPAAPQVPGSRSFEGWPGKNTAAILLFDGALAFPVELFLFICKHVINQMAIDPGK